MRRREQRGSALILVMFAIAVGLVLGAVVLRDVTAEATGGRHERNREAAFSLAEAGLNSEVFVLGNAWPDSAAHAFPASCAPAAGTVYGCPDSGDMARSVSQADANDVPNWSVAVRDDGASSTSWSEGMLASEPSWDANGDGKVWIRAYALAQGRPVTIVGLITQSPTSAGFPGNVITAGWFGTGDNGRTQHVDTVGTAAQPSPLAVRCTGAAPSACLDYPPDKGQVSPDTAQTGYAGGNAVTARVLADFVARAQRAGTYYSGACPSSLAGKVVVIANASCAYQGNDVWNSAASPGTLVLLGGTLDLRGTVNYYGVIYGPNPSGSTSAVVTITGNAVVQGAVQVDGGGGVVVGGSALVRYDPGALYGATTYLTPQLVKSTWRQL